MLPKAKVDELKTALKGFDVDKLITAITATDEQDYIIPTDVSVLTADELTQRDANVTTTAEKAGEAKGEIKGKELAAKAFRKKFGLADTIGTDIDKVVEAVQTELGKGDAGVISQRDKLLVDNEALKTEVENTKKTAAATTFDMQIITMFPPNRTSDLGDDERLMLLKKGIEFVEEGGKMIAKKDGKIIEDPTTHAPLPLNKVIEGVFTERKWVGAGADPGGRGGGNGGAGGAAGIKTFTGYQEKWKVDNPGKNVHGPEFDADLQKHAKENTDFNWNQ